MILTGRGPDQGGTDRAEDYRPYVRGVRIPTRKRGVTLPEMHVPSGKVLQRSVPETALVDTSNMAVRSSAVDPFRERAV